MKVQKIPVIVAMRDDMHLVATTPHFSTILLMWVMGNIFFVCSPLIYGKVICVVYFEKKNNNNNKNLIHSGMNKHRLCDTAAMIWANGGCHNETSFGGCGGDEIGTDCLFCDKWRAADNNRRIFMYNIFRVQASWADWIIIQRTRGDKLLAARNIN